MARLAVLLIVVLSALLPFPPGAQEALAAGGPLINVDGPNDHATLREKADVLGWAVDRAARNNTGVDAVHIYLDGRAGVGRMLGQADYGLVRQDVARQLGAP